MPEKKQSADFSLLLCVLVPSGHDYICSRASPFPFHEDPQTHIRHRKAHIWTTNNTTTRSNSYKYGAGVAIRWRCWSDANTNRTYGRARTCDVMEIARVGLHDFRKSWSWWKSLGIKNLIYCQCFCTFEFEFICFSIWLFTDQTTSQRSCFMCEKTAWIWL